MNLWTPILLKILIIALPLSLTGWLVVRLMKKGPTLRQRGLITMVMTALLVLPLLVWIGPRLMEITLPTPKAQTPLFINFSQSLIVSASPAVSKASWLDWALLSWMGGTVLGLFVLLWGILGVNRHIRRSKPLSLEQIENLRHQLSGYDIELPLQRIRLSDHLQGPAAAGFFKSWIIIPTPLIKHLDAAELKALLLHEWAHIRHHDSLFTLLGRLAGLFYWWNPLVHLLSRERERLQELIGDETAAHSSGELDYAKALLSLAEKSCHDQKLRGVLAFFGPLPLKERIERLLFKEDQMNKRKWQKGILFIGSLAMALMLAAAGTEFVSEKTATASGETAQETKSTEKPLQAENLKQPKLIKRVKPKYPQVALQNRVTSQVTLEITTNVKGEVEKVNVISGHPLFNDAAIEAVKQWVYEPYIIDGKPEPVNFTVVLTFKLGNDDKKEK